MESRGLSLNVADLFFESERLVPEVQGAFDVSLLGDNASHLVESRGLSLHVADHFFESERLVPEVQGAFDVSLLCSEPCQLVKKG